MGEIFRGHQNILSTLDVPNPRLYISIEISCDLPGNMLGISNVSPDYLQLHKNYIIIDYVIIDKALKKILLVELIVPIDININSVHAMKPKRYEITYTIGRKNWMRLIKHPLFGPPRRLSLIHI